MSQGGGLQAANAPMAAIYFIYVSLQKFLLPGGANSHAAAMLTSCVKEVAEQYLPSVSLTRGREVVGSNASMWPAGCKDVS